jgi:hypothetical protein
MCYGQVKKTALPVQQQPQTTKLDDYLVFDNNDIVNPMNDLVNDWFNGQFPQEQQNFIIEQKQPLKAEEPLLDQLFSATTPTDTATPPSIIESSSTASTSIPLIEKYQPILPSTQIFSHPSIFDVNAAEKALLKRQKNTEAARQSRKRKVELMKTMEQKVSELEERNRELEKRNAVLSTENGSSVKRIEALERQVDELHGVLMAFSEQDNKRPKLE